MDLYSTGITAVVAILLLGRRRVREEERVVVFRFNRFLRIAGPGVLLAVPLVDKIARVDLTTQVPHWRSLTKDQLEEAIKDLVRSSGYEVPDRRSRQGAESEERGRPTSSRASAAVPEIDEIP